jgi:phosphoribosylamine-glycine ligase
MKRTPNFLTAEFFGSHFLEIGTARRDEGNAKCVPASKTLLFLKYPRKGSKTSVISEGKQQSGQTAQLPAQLNSTESFSVVLADRSGRVLEVLATDDTQTAAIAFAVSYGTREHASPVVVPTGMLPES